jgi:hypothetical protein
MLNDDDRSREQIAADLSQFTGERISRAMLDAYSSKARREHPIPAHRLLALTVLTGRWDVFDALIFPLGVRLATGSDVDTLMLGNAIRAKKAIDDYIERELNRD